MTGAELTEKLLLSIHPFGPEDASGGGPRILRTLLLDGPMPVISVKTGPTNQKSVSQQFRSLPCRPDFGRIEKTRFNAYFDYLDLLFASRFSRSLRELANSLQPAAIHAVADRLDFWHAYKLSEALNVPFFLSCHDDLRFILEGRPLQKLGMDRLAEAWRGANHTYVICDELGQEYCARYGQRRYDVVTDGVTQIADSIASRKENRLHIYFMGLFHLGYSSNLVALLRSLDQLKADNKDLDVLIRMRCGHVPLDLKQFETPVEVLDFSHDEALLWNELRSADLLYLPWQFGKEYEDRIRFSFSTKLVTYLSSGVPILYHGPPSCATANILKSNEAGILVTELAEESLLKALSRVLAGDYRNLAKNALHVCRERFTKQSQRQKFWTPILDSLAAH